MLDQSRYRLDVRNCGHFLDVLSFRAEEALSQPWHYEVELTCSEADIFVGVIEFQTTLGIYRISKKSADFILREEGYIGTPYVPDNSNSSGVTLGYGYDLDQQTIVSMRSTIADFYTEKNFIRLESAVGVTGQLAKNIIPTI